MRKREEQDMAARHVSGIRLLLVGMVVWGVACASSPTPREEIAQARLAIDQAAQDDAERHAPGEMKKAREKLDRAQEMMRRERYTAARRLADEAKVDAQIAEAKATRQRAKSTVKSMKETVEMLKKEYTDE